MTRIAVFSLARPPIVGGAEIAVKEIIERLPGFNFQIFAHDFQKYGRGKLAKIFYIFRAYREAEKRHQEKPFDAIWSIMAAYAGAAALLFKFRHPEVPLLLTLQEGDSEEHILKRVGVFYPIWKLIFKKADHIQAISNYLGEFARRHGARCPIEVVPNGVAIEKFEIRNSKFETNPKSQNSNAKTVITTSRLVHKNGIDVLIRAAARLKTLIPDSKFIIQILGGGPDEQKLKNLAVELDVAGNIEFLGHVEPDKIPEYLAQADIFVRPSRSEGLGSSFLEAMAAGLPVIGTPVGGIPDFLQSAIPTTRTHPNDPNGKKFGLFGSDSDSSGRGGANGLFVEVDNPKDLAEKITLLLNDDKLSRKLGENGRKLVFENYSWDGISKKMEAIFQKLEIGNLKLEIPRLLIATGIYPPDIGGPATYTKLLEEELPKRGFRISVLPFTKYRRLPKIIRHFAYFFRCLWLSRGAEFLYAQDPVSVGLPAMLVSKLTKKKFIIRVAGDYAWEQAAQRFGVKDGIDDFQKRKYGWQTELLRKIQKWVVDKANLVITPSDYFKNLVIKWTSNPSKVKRIYNGINLNAGGYGNWARWPSQHPNFKKIISAGRLVPWKGFDKLIEFMVDLPDWQLVIIGDGPEMSNLESLIAHFELENRVKLVGAIPREELLEKYLKNADACIFALNTSFESFSFQVIEAMNAGLPVITTKIGNLSEIIKNNREGILIEPNNKKEFLDAVNKITFDQQFRKELTMNAQFKAKEFSIEKTMDNLSQLLWSLK